jgi:hypothetical protein
MPYVSPSGWIEPLLTAGGANSSVRRFHAVQDCPRIQRPEVLIAASRVGEAQRCKTCATE